MCPAYKILQTNHFNVYHDDICWRNWQMQSDWVEGKNGQAFQAKLLPWTGHGGQMPVTSCFESRAVYMWSIHLLRIPFVRTDAVAIFAIIISPISTTKVHSFDVCFGGAFKLLQLDVCLFCFCLLSGNTLIDKKSPIDKANWVKTQQTSNVCFRQVSQEPIFAYVTTKAFNLTSLYCGFYLHRPKIHVHAICHANIVCALCRKNS